MRNAVRWLAIAFVVSAVGFDAGAAEDPSELLRKARQALKAGKAETALRLVNAVLKEDARNVSAYQLRCDIHEMAGNYGQAIADCSQVIRLAPKLVEAYQRRGELHFKAGNFEASIRDFDRYLKARPDFTPRHWQRGISYYYAKRYQEGQRQFEGYQTFDSNDVENAVWRYLCMVPLVGKEKARKSLLKIGDDKRVPMRQVYDLFAGKLEPRDVLAAATAGNPSPEQKNRRLFYAHLYLGLYWESEGNKHKALEHLEQAVRHRIGHYMWDVARVHRDLLKRRGK